MRVQLSLPKDDSFFNRYATLIPTLATIGIIAQVISFLTEAGIIYNIVHSRVFDFAPNYCSLIATIAAIIGAAFLEIGLRKFAPYTVRAFLYERRKGLDLAMTIFIICCFSCLLISCGVLSFNGSKEWISIAASPPKLETTDKADSDYMDKKREIKSIFTSDSLMVVTTCAKQLESEINHFNAKIKKQESDLKRYERKEQRTGLSYKTRKETIRGKIASLETERAGKIKSLESSKTLNLKMLSVTRKADIGMTDSLYLAALGSITLDNDNAISKSQATTDFYGNGLAYFTLICLAVFLCAVTIEEIHKKGSGIKTVAIPNQYHFSQSIPAEFFNMVSEKINFILRNKIATWSESTPNPPIPRLTNVLYDLTHIKQEKVIVKGGEESKKADDLKDHEDKKELPSVTVENLDGTVRTIVRKSYNDTKNDNQRVCAHCSTTYTYRHHKQKYCSDECRIAAWELRTGKELKLKKKKE